MCVAVLCACSLPVLSHQLLQPLWSLTNLQYLALGGSLTVKPQPLSGLGALTHLTTLQLRGVSFPVDGSTLPGLLCLTALQQFEFEGGIGVREYECQRMQLGVLRNCTALQHLQLETVTLVPSRLNDGGEGMVQTTVHGQALQQSNAAAAAGAGRGGRHRDGLGSSSRTSEPCLVPQLQQLAYLELRGVRDDSGVSDHGYHQHHQRTELSEAEQLIVSSGSVLQSLCLANTGLSGRNTWEDVLSEDAVLPHLTALDLRRTYPSMGQPELTRWAWGGGGWGAVRVCKVTVFSCVACLRVLHPECVAP
jgi:hypothetical protein